MTSKPLSAKLMGYTSSAMQFRCQFPPHRRNVIYAASIALPLASVLLWPSNVALTGQAIRDVPVIYKMCRPFAGTYSDDVSRVRHESCGVDEEAMRAAQETRERTISMQRDFEAKRHTLTPQEEDAVLRYIELELVHGTSADHTAELHTLLSTAQVRITGLLEDERFAWSNKERTQLASVKAVIESLQVEYTDRVVSKRELRIVRDRLAPALTGIQALVTDKLRNEPSDTPRVENLVTRIDDLVARVGTVIRDLELSGDAIPLEVRSGHRRALQLVREAKQSCSTARPSGCHQLAEVLDVISEMREPLCELDSPLLDFCS